MSIAVRSSDRVARSHGPALARLFSSAVIRELATYGRSPLATRILRELDADVLLDPSASLAEFFDSLQANLFRNYRNEYIYKNVIANKILLGRHSLSTSFMLTEFRVLDSKADVVVLNGSSHVYEIKSEFDNIARLRKQLRAYQLAFEYVNVITSPGQYEEVLFEVDDSIGVMVLTNRGCITTVRKPQSCKAKIDSGVIFDSLRQPEYVSIVRKRFGSVPDVPNMRIYSSCRELFLQLEPMIAHDEMVHALRRRGDCISFRAFVERVPPSLKAASLACKLSWQERALFAELLAANAKEVLLIT